MIMRSSTPPLLLILCLLCLVTSSQSQASLRANAGDIAAPSNAEAGIINTGAQEDTPTQLRRELKGRNRKKQKKENSKKDEDEEKATEADDEEKATEADDEEKEEVQDEPAESKGDTSDVEEKFEEQIAEARQAEEEEEKEKEQDEEQNNPPEEDTTATEETTEEEDTTTEEEAEDTTTTEETTEEEDTTTEEEEEGEEENDAPSIPLNNLLASAKDLTSNFTKNINTTAISLSACEQIEMTLSFLTSLDFDQEFWKVANFTKAIATDDSSSADDSKSTQRSLTGGKFGGAIWEVYLLQLVLLPVSIVMALFGSNLLHPTVCLAAAGMGIFLVFHLVDFLSRSQSPMVVSLMVQIDCQMKLALSLVSACVSAMLASTFLRFGLFTLGALAAGGVSYLVFDAFPMLDPTRDPITHDDGNIGLHGQLSSELSPFAWIVTTLVGVFGGIFLRWFERCALEMVTAALGGLGFSYCLHTFVTLQGWQLNRSLVFLIANFVAFAGWRFQRDRRLYSAVGYNKKNEEVQQQPLVVPVQAAPYYAAQPQQSAASWNQLQTSIDGLLQRSNNTTNNNNAASGPSEDQILELTRSLNTLLTKMDRTESNVSTETETEKSA